MGGEHSGIRRKFMSGSVACESGTLTANKLTNILLDVVGHMCLFVCLSVCMLRYWM